MIVQEKFKMPFMPTPVQRKQQEPTSGPAEQMEFIRKLTSTMMVGQMNGLDEDVAKVFTVISKLLGDGRHLRISLATAAAIGGNVQPARALLDEGMDDWPSADASKVSVAMALKIGGDPLWRDVCQQTLAISNDNDARIFATNLLE